MGETLDRSTQGQSARADGQSSTPATDTTIPVGQSGNRRTRQEFSTMQVKHACMYTLDENTSRQTLTHTL